ncbi:hypothetical protein VE00_02808 [Pseudogymnoascus sp. WSF 3629]|nr:hypothetical protein VE00_02808 [Pseudogymnoascus sp. WSF 3629]
MATPSPNLLAPSPSPSFPPLEEIVHSESALLKHVSRNYAHTSFETFTSAGYADFAYTVENMRWGASGQGDCTPLPRREMDRMWINVVMEFWVKMAWCWEADVEGIVIALLEREDGKGVEEMWEERKMEYPELDTKLYWPMIGHKGIFEDYLDLNIRAVINPEIRCYLEKLEDGTNYDSESELEEGVSNLELEGDDDEEDAESNDGEIGDAEIAEIADAKTADAHTADAQTADAKTADAEVADAQTADAKIDDGTAFLEALEAAIGMVEGYDASDDDESEIEIKKEDEGSENSLYGIEEAVPNLRLTGPGNKDDVDKEHVDIKQEDIKPEKDVEQEKDIKQEKDFMQEKDIKKEKDGTDTAIYTIRDAISNLHLTESVQNSFADTQATISTPEAANHHAVKPAMDGLNAPGFNAHGAANKLGEKVSRLSIEEHHRATLQNPTQKEWDKMFSTEVKAAANSSFRGEDVVNNPVPNAAPEVMIVPKLEPMDTTGLSESSKLIDRVPHFIPRNDNPAPKDIVDAFDMAYEDACKLPGFWEEPMWHGVEFYKMSPLTLAQHYAAHKANEASYAKNFYSQAAPVFSAPAAANIPAPVFQAPAAANIPAPVFQAQTRAYNPAPLFQGRTGAHYPAPHFHARRAFHHPAPPLQAQAGAHYPGPHFQAQTGAHYPVPHFHARRAIHYPGPPFQAQTGAHYHGPPLQAQTGTHYPRPLFQPPPTISKFAPNYHGNNYSTPNPAPSFHAPPPVPRYASPYSDPSHIPINYFPAIPLPPIFINLTAADFEKMEMYDSLAVPKMRQDPRIKMEEDEDVKFEPERCYSDSVLARKRGRDVDSEDEEMGLERPRKFSG